MIDSIEKTGSITTGAYLHEQERYENCEYSPAVPGVIYQNRKGGIRVERPDKGGHLLLVWTGRVYDVVLNGQGVVGKLGYSGQSDAYVAATNGRLDFTAPDNRTGGHLIAEGATLGDVIGEAGLFWLC